MLQQFIKRHKGLAGVLCLVCFLGVLIILLPATVLAAEDRRNGGDYDRLGFPRGGSAPATVIEEQGDSRTGDDIKEPNIANNLSVTYRDGQGNLSGALRIIVILTLITLAPTLVIMMTSFTRILIVMHFTRAAIGTQTAPPNQVLLGITLFLTFFIMSPVINQINTTAYQPFEAGEISQQEFFDRAMDPLREFMYKQTKTKDVNLFLDIAKIEGVTEVDDIPNMVLIPAFMISELRTAFIIGFLIYIPFIVIDMVVASTLMSMGMMMLPPTTISMPFKVLLFVLADGWNLVIGNLVKTFY
ncbi:MAG: flagellar type III secretion system pore protein FliP [Lachnospiraceae bacterium]|nr:flagellar type III secretion system pore protein FliP [Lachnospiraceae bacterium]